MSDEFFSLLPLCPFLQSTPNPKSASRIPFRLARFTTQGRSTLGLVEGNSTNTVNTVEDTEFSSNNEKKVIEVTSFNNSDEVSCCIMNIVNIMNIINSAASSLAWQTG